MQRAEEALYLVQAVYLRLPLQEGSENLSHISSFASQKMKVFVKKEYKKGEIEDDE